MGSRRAFVRVAAVVCAVALVASACGRLQAASCEDLTGLAEAGEGKPDVQIPDLRPPDELCIEDVQEGDGATAGRRDFVVAHYVGVAWSTGEQFDASWDLGEPAGFPLEQVIDGWSQGMPGMREGGRRVLIVPPDMAYGEEGIPGVIEPDETLVFVVDLVEVD